MSQYINAFIYIYLSTRTAVIEGNVLHIIQGGPEGSILGPTCTVYSYSEHYNAQRCIYPRIRWQRVFDSFDNYNKWKSKFYKKLKRGPRRDYINKPKAVIINKRGTNSGVVFDTKGLRIQPKDWLKHLSIYIDECKAFRNQINRTVEKMSTLLNGILPNLTEYNGIQTCLYKGDLCNSRNHSCKLFSGRK